MLLLIARFRILFFCHPLSACQTCFIVKCEADIIFFTSSTTEALLPLPSFPPSFLHPPYPSFLSSFRPSLLRRTPRVLCVQVRAKFGGTAQRQFGPNRLRIPCIPAGGVDLLIPHIPLYRRAYERTVSECGGVILLYMSKLCC